MCDKVIKVCFRKSCFISKFSDVNKQNELLSWKYQNENEKVKF